MEKPLPHTSKEWEEVYFRNVQTVYRICFTYMKNPADTEDMVQSTFLRLMATRKSFESLEHEKAWLIVTATNLCKDFLKHWWQRREHIDRQERLLARAPEDIDETLQLILDLPDKYKTALYLYYYEGYDSAQIANLLRKPKSTIRNYLYRGRELLKTKLGGDWHEE